MVSGGWKASAVEKEPLAAEINSNSNSNGM